MFQPDLGPPGRHPFSFELSWGPDRLGEWLDPTGDAFLWQEARGSLTAGGLCEAAPCTGTLALDYPRGRIRYTLDFEATSPANGESVLCRYVGEKLRLRPWNLLTTHTTCYGTLVELASGRLVSRSIVTFRLRHLPRFLASLRWV